MKVNYVRYVCTKCRAEDMDKLFEHERAAPIINCWSCKAGYGKTFEEQLATQAGMVPYTGKHLA